MPQLSPHRFRLDGWDALVFFVLLAVAFGVCAWPELSPDSAAKVGIGAGIAGMRVRRWFDRRPDLVYDRPTAKATWTLGPMLVVGVGGVVALFGVLALALIASFQVSEHANQGLGDGLGYLLLPVLVLLIGVLMIWSGLRWGRKMRPDSTERSGSG